MLTLLEDEMEEKTKEQACWIQFSLKDELNWSGWSYTQVKLSQILMET